MALSKSAWARGILRMKRAFIKLVMDRLKIVFNEGRYMIFTRVPFVGR
jgi:hypothetical protein